MQGLWGRAQGLGMDLGLKAFTLRMSILVMIIIPIQGRRFINQGPGLGCRVQSLGPAHDNPTLLANAKVRRLNTKAS